MCRGVCHETKVGLTINPISSDDHSQGSMSYLIDDNNMAHLAPAAAREEDNHGCSDRVV